MIYDGSLNQMSSVRKALLFSAIKEVKVIDNSADFLFYSVSSGTECFMTKLLVAKHKKIHGGKLQNVVCQFLHSLYNFFREGSN